MPDSILDVLTSLQHVNQFPVHGWAQGAESRCYLVLPILRAIQSLQVSTAHDSPALSSRLRFRDVFRAGYFQEMLHRILAVLGKVAKAENAIRTHWPKNDISLEQLACFNEAHQFMPIYIEMFFIYARMLADRLTVALAPLVSNSHMSFPREYKQLLAAADNGSAPSNWDLRVNVNTFLMAIRDNSDWYRLLVGPIGSSPKGIRDTLNHRLVKLQPILYGNEPDQSTVELHFEGLDSDIPKVELLMAVRDVVQGFCKLLSALPVEIWNPQTFVQRDIAVSSKSDWPAVTRFFPQIL